MLKDALKLDRVLLNKSFVFMTKHSILISRCLAEMNHVQAKMSHPIDHFFHF